MRCRAFVRLAFVVALAPLAAGAAACSPPIDLAKALEVTDVFTGYYDDGIHQTNMDGRQVSANKLKPSVTFKLRNVSAQPITSVQIMASFWKSGEDGEWDSTLTNVISSDPLAAGATSAPFTLRSNVAYNSEGARASIFTHGLYKDVVVKLFAKRSGRMYRLGEHPIERVILPHAGRGAPRP